MEVEGDCRNKLRRASIIRRVLRSISEALSHWPNSLLVTAVEA